MVGESYSNISTVDLWLDSQPDLPEDYLSEWPPLKNRRASNQAYSILRQKRQQLMEVSGNAVQSARQASARELRSSSGRPPPTTPTGNRRSKRAPPNLATTAHPTAGIEDAEEERAKQTPRPQSRHSVTNPPFLARPPDPANNTLLDGRAPSDSGESRNTQKARSRSPVMNLGVLQFAEIPVDSRAWDTAVIPADLQGLVVDMEKIGVRIEVIPLAVRDKFRAIGKTIHDFQYAKDDVANAGTGTETEAMDKATGGLGHDQFWFLVSRILQASQECLENAAPEAAWNSEVHSTILRLALEGYWEGDEIWYQDITSARISNKTLVPWNVATGTMQSKIVDYAIIVNPSQDFTSDPSKSLHNHIIEKLRGESSDASINQTKAEWVRFKPIGINIETKRGAIEEDQAHVQLATWVSAQYTRLRQLMVPQTTNRMPSFPVLSVQGQRWLLMIATLRDNGRMDLIKELHLGDTGSVAGVYQVIAAIRRLAEWVSIEYRPWFEREILGQAH